MGTVMAWATGIAGGLGVAVGPVNAAQERRGWFVAIPLSAPTSK